MRLYDLLENKDANLKDNEKLLLKKNYKDIIYRQHFIFDGYNFILDFLLKYDIK